MNSYLIFTIGLIAQILFSARMLVQWILSERAKKVLSPTLFWQLSLIASAILFLYGWLRNDFSIILGQLFAYYVYIWNLKLKGFWTKVPKVLRVIFYILPLIAIGWFAFNLQDTIAHLFKQENIPLWLIIFGVIGQCTFTLRFLYQWYYCRKDMESQLPLTFWIISLTGALLILIYAIIRLDPVLILGQATGFVVYTRNIMIELKDRRSIAQK